MAEGILGPEEPGIHSDCYAPGQHYILNHDGSAMDYGVNVPRQSHYQCKKNVPSVYL